MFRNLLLTILILAILPFGFAWGIEAGSVIKCGSFMQSGSKPAFGITEGAVIQILANEELRSRVLSYTGLFHANTSDDVEGATKLFILQKYFDPNSWLSLNASILAGGLYDIKDEENDLNAAFGVELGASLFKWIGLCGGGLYVPRPETDAFFLYAGIDLLSPL